MRKRLSANDSLFHFILPMKHKRQIITLSLLFCSICLWGQNIQKYYVSKNVESGMLYFIKPLKLFKSCENACYFDQTTRPHNDTVSIGVTFTNKQAFKVDSIAIINKDTIVGKKVEHLFTEQRNNKWWDCRFFVYLTRSELSMLNTENPPVLSFYGMESDGIQIEVKPVVWKQIQKVNDAIYRQIKLNMPLPQEPTTGTITEPAITPSVKPIQPLTKTKTEALREQKQLLDEGILTQEEYDKEKAKLLESD